MISGRFGFLWYGLLLGKTLLTGILGSAQSAHDLRDGLEFLSMLRIRHQARQIEQGQVPDNFLNPDTLSNLERRQLKDVFVVVQELQNVLSKRYVAGRF